jgi:hypothetical protein
MAGRVGLLGVVLVSLAVATPAAAAPLKPCRDDRTARCGAIAVPVHRSDPDRPKLKVRFRILPRTDRSRPALEPIVAAGATARITGRLGGRRVRLTTPAP